MVISLLLCMIAAGAAESKEERPVLRRFTVTLTESQVVISLIALGISFLVLVIIIVNLAIFSHSHQRKQQVLMSQLSDTLTAMTTLHQQVLTPIYKRSRPSSILRKKSVSITDPHMPIEPPVLQSGIEEKDHKAAKKVAVKLHDIRSEAIMEV